MTRAVCLDCGYDTIVFNPKRIVKKFWACPYGHKNIVAMPTPIEAF